jgi:thiol peroxidase
MNQRAGAVTFQGNPLTLLGDELKVGDDCPRVELVANDLSPASLADYAGKVLVLLTVPSLDTPVCDLETRRFNQEAGELGDQVAVVAVSMDLPFAQARWCGAAGVERVVALSDHREAALGLACGVLIKELRLLARAVFVADQAGVVRHAQLVPEMTQEPDYAAVLAAVRELL